MLLVTNQAKTLLFFSKIPRRFYFTHSVPRPVIFVTNQIELDYFKIVNAQTGIGYSDKIHIKFRGFCFKELIVKKMELKFDRRFRFDLKIKRTFKDSDGSLKIGYFSKYIEWELDQKIYKLVGKSDKVRAKFWDSEGVLVAWYNMKFKVSDKSAE